MAFQTPLTVKVRTRHLKLEPLECNDTDLSHASEPCLSYFQSMPRCKGSYIEHMANVAHGRSIWPYCSTGLRYECFTRIRDYSEIMSPLKCSVGILTVAETANL